MDDIITERCAKRIEAYACALEIQRHIGLPDPVDALMIAAQKIRGMGDEQPCSRLKMFVALVLGYYYPTRLSGHNKVFSIVNGVWLAIRCLQDRGRLTSQ